MLETFCLATALAFVFGCAAYDSLISEKGIKAGVAVEKNYTWIYGIKPSLLQYCAVNFVTAVLASGVSVAAYAMHNSPWFYAGLAGPAVLGAKHIQGGLEWRKLGVKL